MPVWLSFAADLAFMVLCSNPSLMSKTCHRWLLRRSPESRPTTVGYPPAEYTALTCKTAMFYRPLGVTNLDWKLCIL